jgi:hypothetical protein
MTTAVLSDRTNVQAACLRAGRVTVTLRMWVWNAQVSSFLGISRAIKTRIPIKDVWERGAEENIWNCGPKREEVRERRRKLHKEELQDIHSWPNSIFYSCGAIALLGPKPPHCYGFEVTHRHTTLGRTPLDEGSVRRRDLYLTTKISTRYRYACPRRDSKPQSQQKSGCRPTP